MIEDAMILSALEDGRREMMEEVVCDECECERVWDLADALSGVWHAVEGS